MEDPGENEEEALEEEEEPMAVEAILSAHQSKFKSTEVEKEVELQFDLGRLLATDLNELDVQSLKYLFLLFFLFYNEFCNQKR